MGAWSEFSYRIGFSSKTEGEIDYTHPKFALGVQEPTRVRILGDHSGYHCGGAAVFSALHEAARAKGWSVVSQREEYDVLVVNGEGTMHNGSKGFHRKMGVLAKAVEAGVPAFLVNSVWQNNPSDYDSVLRKLSGITVRESLSRDDLKNRHGIEPNVAIDASFFAQVEARPGLPVFAGKVAYTDFWEPGQRWVTNPEVVRDGVFLSLKDLTWSETVNSLRVSSLLVTGRHHAVYAACRARKIFAALDGNTHKIRGIGKDAGIVIPIARSADDLKSLASDIHRYSEEFSALFDWMAGQDRSSIFPSLQQAHEAKNRR